MHNIKHAFMLTSSGGEDGELRATRQYREVKYRNTNTKSHIKVQVLNCCTLYIEIHNKDQHSTRYGITLIFLRFSQAGPSESRT